MIENAYDPDTDFNQIPSARQIARQGSGLFWNMAASILAPGSETVHYEPPNQFVEYMRRNIAHYQGQTVAPRPRRGFEWLIAKVASIVAAVPKGAVASPISVVASTPDGAKVNLRIVTDKPETKIKRATQWLAEVLQHGPVPQTEVEARGLDAGYNLKMLKAAKAKLLAISVRKGRKHWVWQLSVVKKPQGF